MAKHIAPTGELRQMAPADLRKDINELRVEVAKMRLNVHAQSEKDTAAYARSKKQLARMLTILAQLESPKALKTAAKNAKVPVSTSSKA